MAKAVMHTFECVRYPDLSFYVCGKKKKFDDGVYKTSAVRDIRVLEKLDDVKKIDDFAGDKDD